MINSLFETFDPLISWLSLSIISLTIPLFFPILNNNFFLNSRNPHIINNTQSFIIGELSASLNNENNNGNTLTLFCIFLLILSLNIAGLLPYVYTITSQILFTLSLALPLWLGIIIFSSTHNTNHFISHIVPLSTPLPLSQFITIIESVSLLIRPITLSVRLCANITAGHILIALCSTPIFMFSPFTLILLILLGLEIAVAFIQSYVFSILLSIYLSETH